jgi:putative DNA modification/repair radical SAM protein
MTNSNKSLNDKLNILSDAAKYDVACTSSGSSRHGEKGKLGNAVSAGICHSFSADGRCISLLKVLFSNECVFDCKYCINRLSNDRPRTTFTPEELCRLVIEFYRRNYIEGLFLSSGVYKSPEHTMEQIYQAIYMLRNQYHFNGYIHVKAIPGAPTELIERLGFLVDRMSVNLELPTEDSLKKLAPHKSHETIFKPMNRIANRISDYRLSIGQSAAMERSSGNRYLPRSIFNRERLEQTERLSPALTKTMLTDNATFIPAGQSTQMIIGATPENDLQLITTTQKLYQQYDLKRVFFSAYIPLNEDAALPALDTAVPMLREHRLYQADWLLRYYGFQAEELLSTKKPNFNILLDPKCDWALQHLENFPIEVNTASYDTLLRVPGLGPKSAMRIVNARRYSHLDFPHLKKMGVVLKRAKYFITCQGRQMYQMRIEENFITRQLIGEDSKQNWSIEHPQTYQQLSLFDDPKMVTPPIIENSNKIMFA